ncbi:MAG: zinc ribbon domain-containing protein [Candidatus Limnocylindrales bacterium]
MAEILTESFCERCGTRYTFEAAAPRARRLVRVRTLTKGLRNYVLSDETSFGEAMADARNDVDRLASSQQLDAFHKTFNFCMSCRQYTCGNCWNAIEGMCLTCAPRLGREILDAPFRTLHAVHTESAAAANGNGHTEPIAASAESAAGGPAASWPTADLRGEPGLADLIADAPTGLPVAEPHTEAASTRALETDQVGREAASAAARTLDLLARFRPVPATPAPATPAPAVDATPPFAAPESEAEPVAEVATPEPALEPAPMPAPEPDTVAAEATPEPAPEILAQPNPTDAVETPQRDDRVETPVWRIVAPDPTVATPLGANGTPAPAAPIGKPTGRRGAPATLDPEWPAATPAWPPRPPVPAAGPQWPAPIQPAPVRGADAVWAQSSRDVLNRPETGVQACVNCGLPLSATARFCRRCGSNQIGA